MAEGKQIDLFLESVIDPNFKDDRNLLEFPFFSIQKRAVTDVLEYNAAGHKIKIIPGQKGIATIWDKDVLIFLASRLKDKLDDGQIFDPEKDKVTIDFAPHDFLKLTGRSTSGRGYELFDDALLRLQSTLVETTVDFGQIGKKDRFPWIGRVETLSRETASGKKIPYRVQISLESWMIRAVFGNRRLLSITKDYFKLKKGLERRLYELARKHCGHQPIWVISLPKLEEKCGSRRKHLRQFKADIKKISIANTIPEYFVHIAETKEDLENLNTEFARLSKRSKFTFKQATVVFRLREGGRLPQELLMPLEEGEKASQGKRKLKVSIEAFDQARRIAPGWDIYYLEEEWLNWCENKDEKIKYPDKAFVSFVKSYIKKRNLNP